MEYSGDRVGTETHVVMYIYVTKFASTHLPLEETNVDDEEPLRSLTVMPSN